MSTFATETLITGLEFATVLVKDQQQALRFYTEALGFELENDQNLPEGRWLTVRAPGAQTGIALVADPHAHADEEAGCCGSGGCGSCGTSYAWTGLTLATGDVEGACRALAGQGVAILQGPEPRAWGREALFADPDGNVFSLVQR